MMMRIAPLLTLIFLSFSIYSQSSGTITGVITNQESSLPIQDVYVFVEKASNGTITDGIGHFTIKNLSPGNYILVASNLGYKTIERPFEIKAGQEIRVDLQMLESLYDLPNVLIESISLTGGYSGLGDLHGSAHYISKKELTKFNHSDINKILKSVPGVQIQEEDGFGLRPNIGIRGTSTERSAKITLMEDGVLIAPAPYSAPSAYYFPTIGRMDGVELLKGSSQIKHGPYTTGGALNLLSKHIPLSPEAIIDLSAGSFFNRKIEASFGNRVDNVGYLVQGFNYGSSGFKSLDNGEDTGFNKTDILAKFGVNSGNTNGIYHSLEFKFGYTNELSNETYLGLSEADFDHTPYLRYAGSQVDQMDANHQAYTASYTIEFSPGIQMNTTAYHNYFHRNWYKLDKVTNGEGDKSGISSILNDIETYSRAYEILKGADSGLDNLYVKANNRTYRSSGVQSIAHFYFSKAKNKHKLNLGFRYHYDEMDRFQWIDSYKMMDGLMIISDHGIAGTESNRIHTAKAMAGFVRLDLRWQNFSVNPGIRIESMSLSRDDYGKEDPERTGINLSQMQNKETVLIPGISFNYATKKGFDLFGGVHKGFSPPSTKDESSPESSINYELGTKLNKGAFNSQLVFFYTDYSNLLGSDVSAGGGAGNDELFNGGEVEVSGLEYQMDFTFNNLFQRDIQLPISLNYSYTNAVFQSSFDSELDIWGEVTEGDMIPYLSKHQLSAGAGLEHKAFGLHFQANYNSPMLVKAGTLDSETKFKMDEGFAMDASFDYRIKRNLKAYINIINLSNNVTRIARHPAGLRPSTPRTIMLGLRLEL